MTAFVRTILVTAVVLPVLGCQVDPEYDFSKLDTTITLFQGLELPVPDAQILLKDVFSLEEDYSFIRCDGDGNYFIHLDMDSIDMSFPIPNSGSDKIPVPFMPVEYRFDGVSDVFAGKDNSVIMDLSEMVVTLAVNSDVPATATADVTIDAIRSGQVSNRCSVDGLEIQEGSNLHYFVEKESSTFPNFYRVVPNLGAMFSPIPDALRLSALDVYMDAGQRSMLNPGALYNVSCQLSAESPICFAAGTHFSMSTPLNAELSLDEIGLKTAILNLVIENTIPLDFTFRLQAYDAAGNRLDSIQVTPDFEKIPALSIIGGSITLTTPGDLRFSSLSFELTASAPANSAQVGTCLNRNQFLRFSGMNLFLPDGVQIRLDAISANL